MEEGSAKQAAAQRIAELFKSPDVPTFPMTRTLTT